MFGNGFRFYKLTFILLIQKKYTFKIELLKVRKFMSTKHNKNVIID